MKKLLVALFLVVSLAWGQRTPLVIEDADNLLGENCDSFDTHMYIVRTTGELIYCDGSNWVQVPVVTDVADVDSLRSAKNPCIDVTHTDYGVVMDTGSDEAVDFAKAVTEAKADGEGTICVPSGEVTLSDLTIDGNNIRLVGAGIGVTVLKLADNTDAEFIKITGDNVIVENLSIDGNDANNTGGVDALIFRDIDTGFLRNVHIYSADDDNIVFEDSDGGGANLCLNAFVDNVISEDAGNMGLRYKGCIRGHVANSFFFNNDNSGADMDASTFLVDLNNLIAHNNGGSGAFIEEGSRWITVNGGIFTGNTLHGILINENGTNTVQNITLNGPIVRRNDRHGVRVRANTSGGTVKNVTMTGVVADENSQGTTNTYSGIHISAETGATVDTVLITGAIATDDQGTPTQKYGIETGGGGTVTNIHHWNNRFAGNSTGSTNLTQDYFIGDGDAEDVRLAFDLDTDQFLTWDESEDMLSVDDFLNTGQGVIRPGAGSAYTLNADSDDFFIDAGSGNVGMTLGGDEATIAFHDGTTDQAALLKYVKSTGVMTYYTGTASGSFHQWDVFNVPNIMNLSATGLSINTRFTSTGGGGHEDSVFFTDVLSASANLEAIGVNDGTNDRLKLEWDGDIHWGNSGTTYDTRLYRPSADTLKTDDDMVIDGATIFDTALTAFADADTTPSVANGSFFQTANTGATVITTFDGGTTGQEIVVHVNDANTDFDCTASGLVCGGAVTGADWTTATTGDFMRCRYDGTDWLCVCMDTTP